MVPPTVSTGPRLASPGDAPVLAHGPVTTTEYTTVDGRVPRTAHVVVVGQTTPGVGTEREVSVVSRTQTGLVPRPVTWPGPRAVPATPSVEVTPDESPSAPPRLVTLGQPTAPVPAPRLGVVAPTVDGVVDVGTEGTVDVVMVVHTARRARV